MTGTEDVTKEPSQATDPRKLPRLFLQRLEVKNFRTLGDVRFDFQPGLNVLIGENNSGKTAVIDSLRLILNLGTFENKEDFIRPRATDARLAPESGADQENITTTISATFMGEDSAGTSSQFYDLLTTGTPVFYPEYPESSFSKFQLQYSIEFRYSASKGRYETARTEVRGGDSFANPVQNETLDNLRAIYLAPLRDLVNDRSRVGAEIERLVLSHTPPEKSGARKEIPEKLRNLAETLIHDLTGGKHQLAAGQNLSSYSTPYGIDASTLTFAPTGISDALLNTLVPLFDHSLGVAEQLPLSSNGLGLNQLIYASIVLSRQGSGTFDSHLHRFFIIEEPEAHLHPQLQDSFFYALNRITEHQLFVTSHSPTLSAKTDIQKMIVVERDRTSGSTTPRHLAQAYADRESDRRYLHKFLDVTRSQLLFARGAIFVEGVTEAMLLEQFSQIIGLSLRDHSVEIVVVDSSHGFERFRPLFETSSGSLQRAAFLTDSDVEPENIEKEASNLSAPALDKIDVLMPGRTMVATGYGTFEFGLLRNSLVGDGADFGRSVLRSSMVAAAPAVVSDASHSEAFANDFMDFDNPALAYMKMKQGRSAGLVEADQWRGTWTTNSYFRAAKSDFSYHLSSALDDEANMARRASFPVPHYIREAVRFVTSS